MDEASARRVVLAQAIESADVHEKLLSREARDRIDRQTREEGRAAASVDTPASLEPLLHQRALRILQALAGHSAITRLQEPPGVVRTLRFALPLGALLAGLLIDRVANPHRVDLLSLPLLAVVGWNLVAYAVLIARSIWRRSRHLAPAEPAPLALARWIGTHGWWSRAAAVESRVRVGFLHRWHQATRTLQAQRVLVTLHLTAAAWAAGIVCSLFLRGLVVEYRVGWESTFLDAAQVHAALQALLLPAVAFFGLAPVSLQEVEALRFEGSEGAIGGARWVYLHASLLFLVVMVPRLILAGVGIWRARKLARHVVLDMDDPYFERLTALLMPLRISIGWHAPRKGDGEALLRVLVRPLDAQARLAPAHTLVISAEGDRLLLMELPVGEEVDLAMLVVSDPADVPRGIPHVCKGARPVLVLVNPPADGDSGALLEACRAQASAELAHVEFLSFADFARCWVQERVLLGAIQRGLTGARSKGFPRLASAWEERSHERFRLSMSVLALQLLEAAREIERVPESSFSIKSLLPAERKVQREAMERATAAVVARLRSSAAVTLIQLLEVHGLPAGEAAGLEERLEQDFAVQQNVSTPQAGVAGAAAGAATGATVDLALGGLTLGAAAAIGAAVGGSAALAAAFWNNRHTSAGISTIQLSDNMLQDHADAALLRYLAVCHHQRWPQRQAGLMPPEWKSIVVATIQAHQKSLAALWAAERDGKGGDTARALAAELQKAGQEILHRLYPPMPVPAAP